MRHYIYIILAMLMLSSGNAIAQRDIPAVLVHLKDGTTDTICLEQELNFSAFSFRGVDNPQPGSYVDVYSQIVGINWIDFSILLRSEKTKVGEHFFSSFENNYRGVIISTGDIDTTKLADIVYHYNCVIVCDGGNTTVYQPYRSSKWGNYVYKDYQQTNVISLPADGKEYNVCAFAVDGSTVSSPRYFSEIKKVVAPKIMQNPANREGYKYFLYNGQKRIGIAFNCDTEVLKKKYASDFAKLSDNDSEKIIEIVLNNLHLDDSELVKAAVKSEECYDGMLYFVNSLPAKAESDLMAVVRASAKGTILDNLHKVDGISNVASIVQNNSNYVVNEEQSKACTEDARFSPLVLDKVNDLFGAKNLADISKRYTFIAPDNKAWNEALSKASSCYNYISDFYYMDIRNNTTAVASISASTGRRNTFVNGEELDNVVEKELVRGLALTDGELASLGDIQSYCTATTACANGEIKTVNSYCLAPWMSYNPSLEYQQPCRVLGLASGAKPAMHNILKSELVGRDSIFANVPEFIKKRILSEDSEYFSYIGADESILSNQSARPEIDFSLTDMRSTKYHIFVVTVPSQMHNPERAVPTDGLYLRFDIAYTDAGGTQQFRRLNVPGALKATDDIKLRPDMVNVVELEFDCPISYYRLSGDYDDVAPTFFISHTKTFTLPPFRKVFERELHIAGIYAITDEEYQAIRNK